MPDKFRDVFPVPISFTSGEQPTAAKLLAFAAQVNSGLEQIEKALGDMRSAYFPLFASTNTPTGNWAFNQSGTALSSVQLHLQQLSLARLIGPASALNPRVLPNTSMTITAEPLPDNVNEFYLRFRPSGPVSFSNTTKFFSAVATPDLITSFGEYYIDTATGKVVVWDGSDVTSSNGTATYSIATSTDGLTDTYEGAVFNVIPGPQQLTKCLVAASGDNWRLNLPILTDQQADWGHNGTTLSADADPNYGKQLSLPSWLTAEYSASQTIAAGLLAIWDEDERRMITSGDFIYVSSTAVDYDGETLETGSNRYSLVVAGGTDITRTLDAVRTKVREHTHDGTNGDMRVSHKELNYLAVGHVTSDAGNPSYSFFDDGTGDFDNHHPQYLGRWGSDGTTSKNAMLGNLLIASVPSGGSTAPRFGTSFYSFKMIFGGTGGPELRFDHILDGLHLDNKDLILANDYKFESARSTSVVLSTGAGWFDQNASTPAEYTDDGGGLILVQMNESGDSFQIDLNSYIPEGAAIASVDLGLQFGNGTSVRAVAVDILEDTYSNAGATTAVSDSASSLGASPTPNLTLAHTIDKTHRTILEITPTWTGGTGPTRYCQIKGIRVNFTHDTIHRGG